MGKALKKEVGTKAEGEGWQVGVTRLAEVSKVKGMIDYIIDAAVLIEAGVPSRPRPAAKPKTELKVPSDLTAALKKNKIAAATFGKFSPSHRKEYIEWITEAKRDETRQKRLATTLEWLIEGKPRNWKYMNC